MSAPAPSLRAVAAAFVRRDVAVAASYRLSFLLRTLWLLGTFAAFAYLAQFVGPDAGGMVGRYGEAGFMGFWLIGLVGAELFYTLTTAIGRAIRQAQLEGTLEAVLATPTPPVYIVACAPLTAIGAALVRSLLDLAIGALLFGVGFGSIDPLALLLVVAAALAAFAGLAVLSGAITLWLRRTDPVAAALGMAGVLIGGVLFPVDVLPDLAARLSYLFPLAPALEGLRQVLFAGADTAAIARELLVLALFAGVVAPIAVALFAAGLRRARADGSLSHY